MPVGAGGLADILEVVKYLRAHDDVAHQIAQRSKQFAQQYLLEEGRLCYIKVWVGGWVGGVKIGVDWRVWGASHDNGVPAVLQGDPQLALLKRRSRMCR